MKAFKGKKALTLVEVLVATAIFAFCIAGLLLTYMNLFVLTDLSRDFTTANTALITQMETVRSTSFANLPALNNTVFNVVDKNFWVNGSPMVIGSGRICIYNVNDPFTNVTYLDIMRARVIISYISRGRTIGSSAACGEYANGTSQGLSPVEGVVMIKNFTNSTN